MGTMEGLYRGYRLSPVTTDCGWSVLIQDPAGHPADVLLHRQLGHSGWTSQNAADRAAHVFIDALHDQDGSY